MFPGSKANIRVPRWNKSLGRIHPEQTLFLSFPISDFQPMEHRKYYVMILGGWGRYQNDYKLITKDYRGGGWSHCQIFLSEVKIWLRYDIKHEDNFKLKVTFLMNISIYRSLWIMEGPNGF